MAGLSRHQRRRSVRGPRTKCQDQRDQCPAGGDRVGQQRDADVPAAQPLRHDPRPDHGRDEQRRSQPFRDELARERYLHALGPQDFRSLV